MNRNERNERSLNAVFNLERSTLSLLECKLNLDRLLKKHGGNGFAIISACKNPEEYPDWNNEKKSAELEKAIQDAGYSYTTAWGGYEGIDNDSYNASYEKSFIVYNYVSHDNWHQDKQAGGIGELRNFAVTMCKRFEQESVYFKAPNEAPVWLDENGNVVSKRSSEKVWKNDPNMPYFTSLKGEKGVEGELREKWKHIYKVILNYGNKPYKEEEFEKFFQEHKGERSFTDEKGKVWNIDSIGRRYTADIESAFSLLSSLGIERVAKRALGFQAAYRQDCRGEIGVRAD
jgi:hypothetical protein